jgi:hypothetical protein
MEIDGRARTALTEALHNGKLSYDGNLTITYDTGSITLARMDTNDPNDPTSFLDCAPDDRVAFSAPSGSAIEPAPPLYIELNLPGIEPATTSCA